MLRHSARALRSVSPARLGGAAASTICRRLSTEVPPSESLLIADPRGLRVVDLNRPKALNALNAEMIATLLPLMQDWQQPKGDVKMIAFRGTGEKAFCAGGDIRFLREAALGLEGKTLEMGHDFFREEYTLNHTIGTSRIPVVSLLDGITMGGGVGLSVHGSVRVATENTLFAMPETGIGFFPDVGGTYFLPRLRGKLGMYLGLTGARLTGREVVAAGVATHFVPEALLPTLEGMLMEFASRPGQIDADVLSAAISTLDQLDSGKVAARPTFLDEHAAQIDECFGQPDVPSIVAAVAGAGFAAIDAADGDKHWAVRASKELRRASPTSLAVTHEALLRGGAAASLGECLQMEFRMSQRFLLHPDMASGIGAVLTKGAEPALWAAVPSRDVVEEFFAAGSGGDLHLP